jgi:hypothetical protein
MKLSTHKMVDHRSILAGYLPQNGLAELEMMSSGLGSTMGSCCSAAGAVTVTVTKQLDDKPSLALL